MSLDEAKLLGSIADQYMDDETQEEVNVRSLMYYNEQELFDKISDVNLSKFELEFLYGRLINTTGTFWSLIFKETIKVFSLNTLKPLCKNDLSSTQVFHKIDFHVLILLQ